MSITSLYFVVFIFLLFAVYFAVPKKYQWIVLLLFSLLFYLMAGGESIVYVLVTSVTVYAAVNLMQRITEKQKVFLRENKDNLSREEKKEYKQKNRTRRKALMLTALLINLAILCTFKYLHFAVEQINALLGIAGAPLLDNGFSLIAPLGVSFYTFQSIGYLVDVYWENTEAERNYAKTLLFVSFFPQMTQGPISNFEKLSGELFTEHSFSYRNYSRGLWRMLWGFAKKMVLANMLSGYVSDVFRNYGSYTGITVFIGALMYSVQIYADFSGYMDIMCGICQVMGIRLTENFERPYFSKSVAEYWRRWHISLGEWFKKYIYFPIAMAPWNRKLAKTAKEKAGKHVGDSLPATIALIVTWLATGLWHGASWSYIVWGGVNGFFIILSLWLEPLYDKSKKALHINDQSRGWQAFQVLRTFLLVTFIKVLPEVGTLKQGLGLVGRIFSEHTIPPLSGLLPFVGSKLDLAVVLFMTAALFAVSLIQRKRDVRDYMEKLPLLCRALVLTAVFLMIMVFGVPATIVSGGFMYAQF